jgi:hypothetical protein
MSKVDRTARTKKLAKECCDEDMSRTYLGLAIAKLILQEDEMRGNRLKMLQMS